MKIICYSENDYIDSPTDDKETKVYPLVYLKPDSSVLKNSKPFFIPDFTEDIILSLKLVVKLDRLGKNISERFAHRYYNEITLGADLIAMDLNDRLKIHNMPWDLSVAFDNSAVIGTFIEKNRIKDKCSDIMLNVDALPGVKYRLTDWDITINRAIEYLSAFFTLKIGDIIMLDLGIRTEKLNIENKIIGKINNEQVLSFQIL